MKISSYP